MFALTKVLRPAALIRLARPAFISSNLKELETDLSKTLKTEFEGEEADEEREKFIRDFLKDKKWRIETSDDSTRVVLSKQENGHSIRVIYDAKLPENEDQAEEGQKNEEGEGDQNYTEFVVVVDKKKPQKMLIDVIAVDGEINVNGIIFSAEADKLAERKTVESFPYNGPSFETLEEGLQQKISKYIEGLGINEELAHFIEETSIHHEAKLYKGFLQQFREFVE